MTVELDLYYKRTCCLPLGRRPPKMMASIGTPSGASQAGSMMGHWRAGTQKREFGCTEHAQQDSLYVPQRDACVHKVGLCHPREPGIVVDNFIVRLDIGIILDL